MDSPSQHTDTLNYIVQFLHTNGLYAAEDALVRELENRYPELEASSPTDLAPVQPFQPSIDAITHTLGAADASAEPDQDDDGFQEHPSRQAVQDRQREHQESHTSQPCSSTSFSHGEAAGSPLTGDRRRVTADDWDEYEDEDDPGYVREDIRGQDAFAARELDASDADGSRRAMDLYHQAMDPSAQEEWVQGEDEERSSSDGRGSSYFSGERLDQIHSSSASPMRSQQSLTGGIDRSSLPQRTVVLAEPVYPADSPARSNHSMSRAGSTSGDLGVQGAAISTDTTSTATTAGAQNELQASHTRFSDPATRQAAAIAVAASSGAGLARTASTGSQGGSGPGLSSSAPEPASRSFLDPLGIVEKVSDVFSRRVQPRSDSETSKHSTTKVEAAASKALQQAASDAAGPPFKPEAGSLAAAEQHAESRKEQPSTAEQHAESQKEQPSTQGPPSAVDGFKLRVKAPEPSSARPIRTASGVSGKASGLLDPASPSGASEEDENFSFPLTPPSEPAAPAAVFSSWHSFRKRSSKGYDTDDDLSMGRVSDFSVEPSQESNPGLSHSGTETQHTLQKAAGKLDRANTADSSVEGPKSSSEMQPCAADAHPLAIPDFAVEPQQHPQQPQQHMLHSEASLARQITLGKANAPQDGPVCPQDHVPASAEPHEAEEEQSPSAGSTEPRGVALEFSRCSDSGAAVCSSPPREAWPSILLQPQDQSLPAQPCQASMQLPGSSEAAPESPHLHPSHLPICGAADEEGPQLLPEPFGSTVLQRGSQEHQQAAGALHRGSAPAAAEQDALQQSSGARGPATDMLVTPSRLSRASPAMMAQEAGQAMPATPLSTAAECSSPPSMAAFSYEQEDGRPSGMRGIASSSMTSLDGSAAASVREREAAAKARASLDFSSLAERASGGGRPSAHQRARSAEVAAQAQQQQQMLAAVRPLDVSLSLSQHELLNLQKGALQRRKPPPLPTPADGSPAHNAAAAQLAHERSQGPSHPLAGGSPAASAVAATAGTSAAAGEGGADSGFAYEYDSEYIERKYEILELKVIHRRRRTGFEETKDFPIRVDDLIAGRYQVMDFLGSAAFSRAVQALDVKTRRLVCLKIIKNNKDYFDQSLDEIKLLSHINAADPLDEHGLLRLYDYFYYKEHLFLVCELLRANLYEFQKYNRDSGNPPYFILQRVQSIARQVLTSLAFLHSLGLIHSDLKPENILIKSYSRCEVKVIDFGSSCFTTDQLSSYVQSRSYRAPEVILGLSYGQKVDVWSLGCILAELLSGYVLFQNDSLATLLARLEGILGPVPDRMLSQGRYTHRYYTRSGALFERNPRTHRYEYLHPKQTNIGKRVPEADEACIDFLQHLLTIDPEKRPTAETALQHPWLQHQYPAPPAQ